MKGVTSWSFRPYSPFFHNTGDIYVCRVEPDTDGCSVEWLGERGKEYKLMLRAGKEGNFAAAGRTGECRFRFNGLKRDTDYGFYVCDGEKKSRVRLFRTGEVPGTVVNYLHPRDEAYAFSGRYLCSPSFVRLNGALISSMDLFAPGAPQNLTLIYRSDDDGATWRYVSELMPCFWGKLFVLRGKLYMLAVTTEYGDLVIGRSDDMGYTFTPPVTLLRGSNGKAGNAGVHKNPQPLVEYKGRLYGSLEWGSWASGYHAAMVMSMDVDDDPLDPESWMFSQPVKYDEAWPGVAKGRSTGMIEGALAVDHKNDVLYNVMRYDMTKCTPNYGMALVFRVDTEKYEAPLEFAGTAKLEGNHSKFLIRYDEKSGLYWSIVSRITDAENAGSRNLLSLMVSRDLFDWKLAYDLIDMRDEDPKLIGFQYVDFMIEGDDLVFLCRTAMNGADSFHNANYQTFHRVKGFREKPHARDAVRVGE